MQPDALDRRRLFALGGAWLGLTAMTRQELTPAQQKLLAAHFSNDDPAWATLADARVSEDKERGVLKAAFPAELLAMRGQPFRISGFMTPLEAKAKTRHFLVTRRSTTCPFCPPNAPTEAVEVITDGPVALVQEEVAVSGRLVLLDNSNNGLFFGLSHADCGLTPRGAQALAAR